MAGSLTWYVARGSGIAAYLLLTLSVVFGVALNRRWYSRAMPRLVVDGWHRWLTLSFYIFVVLHVITLLLDPFTRFSLADLLIPFHSSYRPVWMSLGIVAAELGLALGASVFIRRWIGYRAWHALHGLTYLLFPMSLIHGLGTGSDTRAGWDLALYAGSGLLVIGVVAWRAASSPRWRVPAVTASAVLALAVLVWALAGPLAPGWARASGTPQQLLDQSQSAQASMVQANQPVATTILPADLSERVSGQVLLSSDRSQVLLRGTGSGTVALEIALQVDNRAAGGSGQVQLRDQQQTPLCSGPVTGNDSYTITATCSAYGQSVDLRIVLQEIDLRGFSGTLTVLKSSHV